MKNALQRHASENSRNNSNILNCYLQVTIIGPSS